MLRDQFDESNDNVVSSSARAFQCWCCPVWAALSDPALQCSDILRCMSERNFLSVCGGCRTLFRNHHLSVHHARSRLARNAGWCPSGLRLGTCTPGQHGKDRFQSILQCTSGAQGDRPLSTWPHPLANLDSKRYHSRDACTAQFRICRTLHRSTCKSCQIRRTWRC